MNKLTPKLSTAQSSPFDAYYHLMETPRSSFLKEKSSFSERKGSNLIPIDLDLKMPLIFLPKNSDNDLWKNIASDILRSIHSEYSFAKKSDFGVKKQKTIKIDKELFSEEHQSTQGQSLSARSDFLFFQKNSLKIINLSR